MAAPARITGPFLDVLELLFAAYAEADNQLHGWAIMKTTKRSGPTVYGVLDRLEDMGWIEGRWEEQQPDQSSPRRRLYTLTPDGLAGAQDILRHRRPAALHARRTQLPGWQSVPGQAGAG